MTWLGLLLWRLRWFRARPLGLTRPPPVLLVIGDDYADTTTVGMPMGTDDSPDEGVWVH